MIQKHERNNLESRTDSCVRSPISGISSVVQKINKKEVVSLNLSCLFDFLLV